MDDSVTPDEIMQLGMGFWGSKTLLSAIELGLFTELAEGPLDAETLRTRLGLHARSHKDFLDALVALGMLQREDGRYANTPATAQFLDRAKPTYVGGILEMANQRLYPFWGHLTDALRTGQPQNEIKDGTDFFGTLYKDPALLEHFLAAMTGVSAGSAHALARKFPWTDYGTFVDVGAAQGALPVAVAQAHPHLKGIGFDLPPVGPVFEKFVAAHGLHDRVRFTAGDFFRDDLPKADVVVMGHVLHDWNLDEKRLLIRKAYDALPEGGAFVAYESLIDDERKESAHGLLMSLNMLIETPGGFDFSGADAKRWFEEAGFRETRVEHLVGPESMVIGIK